MSPLMDPATLTRLKILVEQAVRPVRAGRRRKLKMREELLADVRAVFEEERARDGDDRAALERTEQRFGDPALTTDRLQRSVPWAASILVRVWTDPFFPWEEDRGRLLRRHLYQCGVAALLATLFGLGVVGVLFAVTWDIRPATVWNWRVPLLLPAGGFIFCFLVYSSVVLLAHGLWHALYGPAGRSWPRLVLLSAVAGGIGSTFMILLYLESWPDMRAILWNLLSTLPAAAAIGPYYLIFVLYLIHRTIHGPLDGPWYRTLLRDAAPGVALMAGAFGLGLLISADVEIGWKNASAVLMVTATHLLPLDLFLLVPKLAARIHANLEWERLPLPS